MNARKTNPSEWIRVRLVPSDRNWLMCIRCGLFKCELALACAFGDEPVAGIHKRCARDFRRETRIARKGGEPPPAPDRASSAARSSTRTADAVEAMRAGHARIRAEQDAYVAKARDCTCIVIGEPDANGVVPVAGDRRCPVHSKDFPPAAAGSFDILELGAANGCTCSVGPDKGSGIELALNNPACSVHGGLR